MSRNLYLQMPNFIIWRFIFVYLLFRLQVLGAKEKRISMTVNDASWLCDNLFVFWRRATIALYETLSKKVQPLFDFVVSCIGADQFLLNLHCSHYSVLQLVTVLMQIWDGVRIPSSQVIFILKTILVFFTWLKAFFFWKWFWKFCLYIKTASTSTLH